MLMLGERERVSCWGSPSIVRCSGVSGPFGGMVGARHSNDGGLSFKTGSACARGENLLFI